MIRYIRTAVLFCLVSTASLAGPRPMDLADLAPVTDTERATLTAPHFRVFEAQLVLAVSRARVNESKGAFKAAGRLVDAEEADKKAAEAELDAARKHDDRTRVAAARLLVSAAEADLKTAKAFEAWKKADVKLTQLKVREAQRTLTFRLAEWEYAKLNALNRSLKSPSPKYSAADFQQAVREARDQAETGTTKAAKESLKVAILETAWKTASKQ